MNSTVLENAMEVSRAQAGHEAYSILIVDDDVNFRRGIQRLFYLLSHEMSCRGYEASCGEQAMDLIKRHRVNCVMLDYKMTGGSGLEWLARILEMDANLPVIMVTGAGDEEIAVAALKNGAQDYLVKGSISQDTLRRSLLNAIEKARMRATLERLQQELLDAERQKVMIQTLGAACHHLGQPATALQCCLDLLRRMQLPADAMDLLRQSTDAMNEIGSILHELQRASAFSTTPYRPRAAGERERCDEEILRIA